MVYALYLYVAGTSLNADSHEKPGDLGYLFFRQANFTPHLAPETLGSNEHGKHCGRNRDLANKGNADLN
jgi:hypothetical protein